MPRDVPTTSLDAFDSLEPERELNWTEKILHALIEEPDTARWLAQRFADQDGEDPEAVYHALERRTSTLYAKGYIDKGLKKKNPSGQDAFILHVSHAGRHWLNGGPEPRPRPRTRDLEAAVIKAATDYADKWAATDPPLGALLAAVKALREHKAPPPVEVEKAREAAQEGFHAGRSRTVPIKDMNDRHLLNAVDRLRRDGVRDTDPRLQELLKEADNRSLWA